MAEKQVGPASRAKTRGGTSSSAASRRVASMAYTATPHQAKKVSDPKGGKTAKTISAKKRQELEEAQKQKEELSVLHEQLNDLQKKLIEKDEALKSAENLISHMSSANVTLDELRSQLVEKETLIASTGSELHGAKIMLADKQAALEKLEREAMLSSTKVEELQVDVASMDIEVSALMKLFRKLSENGSATHLRERIDLSFEFEPVLLEDIIGEIDMEKMEREMSAYIAALAAAKENPTDEFLTAVTEARLRLQAFVL